MSSEDMIRDSLGNFKVQGETVVKFRLKTVKRTKMAPSRLT